MDYIRTVKMDNIEKLQELIDSKGLPTDPTWTDYVLLNYSLIKGKKEIAKMLIERGCRVNLEDQPYPAFTPLHHAVKLGCLELVELLLRKGALIERQNFTNETSLHLAAKLKNDILTDLLLSSPSVAENNNFTDESGLTYLHIASMRNNTSIIEHLLNSNIDINSVISLDASCSPGYTPLHCAIECDKIEAVQMLLSHNADINIKAKDGLTPFLLAVKKSRFEIIPLFKNYTDKGLNVDAQIDLTAQEWPGYAALHFAVESNKVPIIELLLELKADINVKSKTGITPLHIAVKKGRCDIIEILLEHNPDVNCTDSENMCTPLHVATIHRQEKIISMLLNKGADVNIQRTDGMTSLHIAASKSYTKNTSKKNSVFRFPFVFLHRHHCETHCESSFKKKSNEIIDLILSSNNLTVVNPVDHRGLSHFHIACMRKKLDVIQKFLDMGVDINQAVKENSLMWPGYTPLHFAVERERTEIVELLLKNGANTRAVNAKGRSPLHLAITTGQTQNEKIINLIVGALDEEVSEPADNSGITSLHLACMKQCPEFIEDLLNSGSEINRAVNLDSPVWSGYTPLHFAVYFQRMRTVEILLSRNADVNARTLKGLTPLHMACHNRNTDLVKILLDNDADPNCVASKEPGYLGRTPLHLACCLFTPCWSIVKHLLDYGADINIEDSEGAIPLSCFYNIPCQNLNINNILNVLYIYCNFRKHLHRLKTINFPISEKTKKFLKKLESWCKSDLSTMSDEVGFSKLCDSEIKQLKGLKIDNYTILYNILFKDANEMAIHVKNAILQTIVNSADLDKKYPVYGYLLRLQFKKGIARGNLLKPAKDSLELTSRLTLPDACSERIFRYLSNEDLISLIESRNLKAFILEKPVGEPSKKRPRVD